MEIKVKYSRFHHNAKQTSFTSPTGPRKFRKYFNSYIVLKLYDKGPIQFLSTESQLRIC